MRAAWLAGHDLERAAVLGLAPRRRLLLALIGGRTKQQRQIAPSCIGGQLGHLGQCGVRVRGSGPASASTRPRRRWPSASVGIGEQGLRDTRPLRSSSARRAPRSATPRRCPDALRSTRPAGRAGPALRGTRRRRAGRSASPGNDLPRLDRAAARARSDPGAAAAATPRAARRGAARRRGAAWPLDAATEVDQPIGELERQTLMLDRRLGAAGLLHGDGGVDV